MFCFLLALKTEVNFYQLLGNILNDNGINVDHLGHEVYAEALVKQIKRIKTPITIGIFARWGSGKSSLMRHVQCKCQAN